MQMAVKTNIKSRVMALLMALVLVLGLAGSSLSAFSPVTAYAADSLFDIVNDDSGKINSDSDAIKTNSDGSIKTLITQYKSIAVAITGILTITMLIFMLIQFTKLGAAGDNQMARQKAIMGILTTGIATMLLGGATIVVGFFWNVLNDTSAGG